MATYKVEADGKAPKGAKVGDNIVTGGGTVTITGIDDNGNFTSSLLSKGMTTYNTPSSAYAGGVSSSKASTASSSTDYLASALAKAKSAQQAATDYSVSQLESQKPDILKNYGNLRKSAYSNARLSAIGNNEILANQGLAGNLYSSPTSGTSETSRISQNNNLRTNINTLNTEEQSALQSLKNAIAQAKATGQQNLASTEADYLSQIASAQQADAQQKYNESVANRNYDYQVLHDALSRTTEQQNTEYNRKAQDAETLAAYGDFSGYKALGYTDEQISNMQKAYQLQRALANKKSSGSSSSGTTQSGYSTINDLASEIFPQMAAYGSPELWLAMNGKNYGITTESQRQAIIDLYNQTVSNQSNIAATSGKTYASTYSLDDVKSQVSRYISNYKRTENESYLNSAETFLQDMLSLGYITQQEYNAIINES